MLTFLLLGLFFLGLAFGSFLNVVALRYRPEGKVFTKKAVGGRSKCMHCERALRWYELLPLFSFVFLRRKCRTCRGPISWQYPMVEFASGLIFAYLPIFFAKFFNIGNILFYRPQLWSFYAMLVVWAVIFWLLLLMSAIDIRHYLIPNGLVLALLFFGSALVFLKSVAGSWLLPYSRFFVKNYAIIFSFTDNLILNHLLGLVFGGLFFWVLYFATGGKAMGFGDVKLALALGLIMGWPDIVLTSFFAFILGGIWGLGLIIFRIKNLKAKLPFGPFLALGVIATLFFGHTIIQWYFGLAAG